MLLAVDRAQHHYAPDVYIIMAPSAVMIWRYSRHRGASLIASDESAVVQLTADVLGFLGCAYLPTTELFCIYATDGQDGQCFTQ